MGLDEVHTRCTGFAVQPVQRSVETVNEGVADSHQDGGAGWLCEVSMPGIAVSGVEAELDVGRHALADSYEPADDPNLGRFEPHYNAGSPTRSATTKLLSWPVRSVASTLRPATNSTAAGCSPQPVLTHLPGEPRAE